jgi:hypothetical protein
MVETLLDKVSGIQLRGEPIKDSDFGRYRAKVELYASGECYGADCGDCDCGGYCIDSECE